MCLQAYGVERLLKDNDPVRDGDRWNEQVPVRIARGGSSLTRFGASGKPLSSKALPTFSNLDAAVSWSLVMGLALNVAEQTITQSLVRLDCAEDWKLLDESAAYGLWHLPLLGWSVGWAMVWLPDGSRYGCHVWADDDTKVYRSNAEVWRTCAFDDYTAGCRNRARTVGPTTGSCLAAWFARSHRDSPMSFFQKL
jgi:hypothetical protein